MVYSNAIQMYVNYWMSIDGMVYVKFDIACAYLFLVNTVSFDEALFFLCFVPWAIRDYR